MPLAVYDSPTDEQITELRTLFGTKLDNEGHKIEGGFHQKDLDNIYKHDKWLRKFLEHNDLDMKEASKQLWSTCEWRKSFGINDLCEENIRMDYVHDGLMFAHNVDIDGKPLLIFKSKLYVKGSKNLDELKRCFLYWVERVIREVDGDLITIFFDLSESGLSNMDMDYTRYIINTLKYYYPGSLNYILVYDMAWILNATFQIIKKLLPAKAVARLKFINTKTVGEFIDENNQLSCWGGKDDYTFKFVSEKKRSQFQDTEITPPLNNNVVKKVHFANLSPPESPMNESSNVSFLENGDGEMLRIIPHNTIAFVKSGNELLGNVEVVNIDLKPVTYKIKTTAPEKFRVRPSTGVLSPGASTTVNVVLQQGQQVTALNREKFLVMCMGLGNEMSTNSQDLAELWKNTSLNSSAVEQHRLKCSIPSNLDGDSSGRNGALLYGSAGDGYGAGAMQGGDKQMSHFQQTISQLSDTTHRLEGQIKFNQTLQWMTIGVFLLLSIAIVYILKIEIKNSSSQYCLNN